MELFGVPARGFQTARTVMQRLPTNPMDRSTIVTIIPKIITELKPTLFPGKFVIPAAKPGDYELYIVEPSSYFIPSINERQPPTEVQINSVQLAESIVKDYCIGILECDMNTKMPGMFFIPGEWTKSNIKNYTDPSGKTFQQLLDDARQKQKNWYAALVQMADVLWSRSNGNPRAISDDSRLAAETLQLKDKPWMQDHIAVGLVNCKACGELINPSYPVCKHCHAVVDSKKAKELDIQFAVTK